MCWPTYGHVIANMEWTKKSGSALASQLPQFIAYNMKVKSINFSSVWYDVPQGVKDEENNIHSIFVTLILGQKKSGAKNKDDNFLKYFTRIQETSVTASISCFPSKTIPFSRGLAKRIYLLEVVLLEWRMAMGP